MWSLTALWHGANYNFLIWGGILLCCLLVEKLFLLRLLDKSRVIGHLYVLFVVPLSWVAFAVTDLSELGVYMTRLFPFAGHAAGVINHLDYLKYLNDYAPLFLLGVLFAASGDLLSADRAQMDRQGDTARHFRALHVLSGGVGKQSVFVL